MSSSVLHFRGGALGFLAGVFFVFDSGDNVERLDAAGCKAGAGCAASVDESRSGAIDRT
jgi:hypothetical protein